MLTPLISRGFRLRRRVAARGLVVGDAFDRIFFLAERFAPEVPFPLPTTSPLVAPTAAPTAAPNGPPITPPITAPATTRAMRRPLPGEDFCLL